MQQLGQLYSTRAIKMCNAWPLGVHVVPPVACSNLRITFCYDPYHYIHIGKVCQELTSYSP